MIELAVAMAVLVILASVALPNFQALRERRVAAGSAEQLLTHVATARFEAVKRNRRVTVTVLGTAGGTDWCIGSAQGNAACDCRSGTTCDVGMFPSTGSNINERRGARLISTSGLGTGGIMTFDPATGILTDPAQAGTVTMGAPTSTLGYSVRLDVNLLGRATLCIPSGSKPIGGYSTCP